MRMREQVTQRLLAAPDAQSREIATAYLTQVDKQIADIRQSGKAPETIKIKMPDQSEKTFQYDQDQKTYIPLKTTAPGTTGDGPVMPNKLTEGQSKDLSLLNRATESNAILGRGDVLTDETQNALTLLPMDIGNRFMKPDFQVARTNGLSFLSAVLRKESGAAVTPSEENLYGRIFLPRPGDKPETLELKQTLRNAALDGIRDGLEPVKILAIGERSLTREQQTDRVKQRIEESRQRDAGMPMPGKQAGDPKLEQRAPLPEGYTPNRALDDARQAIAAGKDRGAVIKRLQSFGIDSSGL